MKYRIYFLFSILFFFSCQNFFLSVPVITHDSNLPVRDMSNWNFKNNGPIILDGTWELYRNELLTPDDFFNSHVSENKELIHQPISGLALMLKDYGTYHLQIKTGDHPEKLAIYLHYIFSSYKLFINGQEICSSGKVGTTRATTIPGFSAQYGVFFNEDYVLDIVIQVANFYHSKGGLLSSIYLGEANDIIRMRERNLFMDFLIIGALVSMGLYFFLFFMMKRKDMSPFYFAMICLCFALRVLISSEVYMMKIFPTINWTFLLRLEYINFALVAPLFNLFLVEFYNGIYSRKIRNAFILLFIIFFILVIFTPPAFFSQINNIYAFICMLFPLYTCALLTKKFFKDKNPESLIFLAGFGIVMITLLFDLYNNSIGFYIKEFSSIGIFILALLLASFISNRYAKTYKMAEKLSAELYEQVKQKKEELSEENQRQKDFFINFAHETKTPLTLISNYMDSYMNEVKVNNKLLIVKKNIDKLKNDMVNLLDFEKLLKGHSLYKHNRIINCRDILVSKQPLYNKIAQEKAISIQYDIEPQLYIQADPSAFARVIDNLVENAIVYTPAGGQIEVLLKKIDNHMFLSVKDNGIGISEEEFAKILRPYYQITHSKRNIQGIGLGLSIVNNIVNSLNGQLSVKSKLLEGSCFEIKLPLDLNANHTEGISFNTDYIKPVLDCINVKGQKGDSDYQKSHILIVEDNIQMLDFICTELSRIYNVRVAENGQMALDKLAIEPLPDLIISDIMMDEMNGFEFFEIVSNSDQYSGIPFLFLSAKSSLKDKQIGLKKGAFDYIAKPFCMDELSAKIGSILKYSKSQQKQMFSQALRILNNEFLSEDNHIISDFEKKITYYQISGRQKEVALKLIKGLSNKQIADELNISIRTVENHIQAIYKKCNINNRVELANLLD